MLISFLSKGTHAPSPSEYPDLPFYRMSPPSSSSTPPTLATPSPPLVKLVVGITVSRRLLRIKTFKFLAPLNKGKKASHNNFSSEPHSTYFHVRATSKLSFFPLMKMLICRTLLKEHIHFFHKF